ncbi:hypothetical protein [Alkalimonas amylolytica]|uniref:Uncharacterized protein n=1 Tax=Alkalimonas amylolytica TaxID=152573 RepID=A0A1H3XYP7_ALKAM|nr:hypothetical protein [Alkalimonas amylolytica]SEA04433.1 hypothetical protein SAMN04488051_101461 [Alkalimonas amylolytica]
MRPNCLLSIFLLLLLLWLPSTYFLLVDDELRPEVPELLKITGSQRPEVDNYYIQAMRLAEPLLDEQQILQLYVSAERVDLFTPRRRWPELDMLDALYQHPLLCELIDRECRAFLIEHEEEINQLLEDFEGMLRHYEQMQQLSNIRSIDELNVSVNWVGLLALERIYALAIFQLIQQSQLELAEQKLTVWVKQQRKLINVPSRLFVSSLFFHKVDTLFLPLAYELKQHHSGPLPELAMELTPLNHNELTALSSKKFELAETLFVHKDAFEAQGLDGRGIWKRLMLKPNLSLNWLYQNHWDGSGTEIMDPKQWYFEVLARRSVEESTATNLLAALRSKLRRYRNYVGSSVTESFIISLDMHALERIRTDSLLHLYQRYLRYDMGDIDDKSLPAFQENPYTGEPAFYHDHQWCYRLDQLICLP